MITNTVFDELTQLESTDVLVINDYHGRHRDVLRNYQTVIYTCFGEVFNYPQFKSMIESAPETRFVIVTARKYLLEHADNNQYHVFYLPTSYGQYADFIPDKSFDLRKKNFTKRFLSLNNRNQWNRQALAQFLYNTGLIDRFYFSFHANDRFGVGHREVYDETNQIIGNTWFNQGLDLDKLYNLLPITSGLPDPLQTSNDWSFGEEKYYTDTFCSFVNETYIDENHDPFFTEKIFKPIAYGHPFLVFSSTGALDLLQSLGIETFADVFDESYDKIESPQQRFEQLLREIQRVCSLSEKDIHELHNELIPRLSNNQHIFRHILPELYKTEIQKIITEIGVLLRN